MSNFSELLNGDKPLLVDFHATWCQPCKVQAPILQEVAGVVKTNATIIKVDVDKNPQVAVKYGVQGVPTLVLFKKGEVIWKASGVRTKNEIIEQIQKAY